MQNIRTLDIVVDSFSVRGTDSHGEEPEKDIIKDDPRTPSHCFQETIEKVKSAYDYPHRGLYKASVS